MRKEEGVPVFPEDWMGWRGGRLMHHRRREMERCDWGVSWGIGWQEKMKVMALVMAMALGMKQAMRRKNISPEDQAIEQAEPMG